MFDARPGDLNDASRARALAHITGHEVDVLVIGGGVTGAGVALDAITRGLTVALVEARDLASGTSGFSSKLVHGGLRYLAKGDVALAWESAVERAALMTTIAPHLVRPRAFLVPRFAGDGAGGALTEAGIRIADGFRAASGLRARVLPRPRRVSASSARLLAPAIRQRGLHGGLLYWDGAVEDDTRLVIALARTAASRGAHIATGCRVTRSGEREAWIETREGHEIPVRARAIINAAGVWAGDFAPGLRLTPSRGTHLVFPSELLGYPRAVMTAPVPGHFGRYVFVLPQHNGLSYLGLTDEPAPGADGYEPGVPEADVDFLLEIANAALDVRLTRAEMLGAFSGLRPLIGGGPDSAEASRHHVVRARAGEPVTITGGKLTVYRRMAEDAVDAAVHRLGEHPRTRPCITKRVPLIGSPGAAGAPDHGARSHDAERAATIAQVSELWPGDDPNGRIASRLVRRYGWEATRVASIAVHDLRAAAEIAPGANLTGAEVAFALFAEGATTPADVLERRTRLSFSPHLARQAEPRIAAEFARLGQS